MTWVKGQSGNPSGQAKGWDDVRKLARNHGRKALLRLVELMDSDDERVSYMAANAVLDRGWGKAPQAITGEDGEGPVQIDSTSIRAVLQSIVDRSKEAKAIEANKLGLVTGQSASTPVEASVAPAAAKAPKKGRKRKKRRKRKALTPVQTDLELKPLTEKPPPEPEAPIDSLEEDRKPLEMESLFPRLARLADRINSGPVSREDSSGAMEDLSLGIHGKLEPLQRMIDQARGGQVIEAEAVPALGDGGEDE